MIAVEDKLPGINCESQAFNQALLGLVKHNDVF